MKCSSEHWTVALFYIIKKSHKPYFGAKLKIDFVKNSFQYFQKYFSPVAVLRWENKSRTHTLLLVGLWTTTFFQIKGIIDYVRIMGHYHPGAVRCLTWTLTLPVLWPVININQQSWIISQLWLLSTVLSSTLQASSHHLRCCYWETDHIHVCTQTWNINIWFEFHHQELICGFLIVPFSSQLIVNLTLWE